MASVRFENVTHSFGETNLFDRFSCTLNSRFIVLFGPSGSGKTTLLRMILGLVSPQEGCVKPECDDNQNRLPRFSYCPVDGNNLGVLSAFDNLYAVCGSKQTVDSILKDFGLYGKRRRKAQTLSKGERDRLSIARAILIPSDFLILDEPTANLDAENARFVFECLKQESCKRTVIVATHDRNLAEEFGEEIVSVGQMISVQRRLATSPVRNDSEQKVLQRKSPLAPFGKLGVRTAASKIIPFSLASFSLLVGLISGFAGFSLSKTDEKATLVGAFKESGGVVCHDKRITYDNLSESQFSPIDSYGDAGGPVFELHYNGPDEWMGYSLEAVDYETSLVYCKQGKNPEDESYSALVKAYENVEPTPGVIGKNHYPIVLSDKQLDYLNEVMFLDVQIGDVLPFSFYQTFSFRASFVLVDSYSAGNSVARGDLSSLPPAILPSSAVQCFHENVGLFSDAFESSIGRAFERLDTYIDDNGVDLEKTGRNENYRFTEHTFKSASSVGMRFYPSEAELPLEESLCIYWGQLPANEDEIMVPSKDVFDYLSPNGANASKLAGFFDEYPDGFPLAVEEGAYAGFSLPHLKIVGAYEPLGPAMRNSSGEIILNEDGTPKRPFFTSFCCPTIVHDNVYAGAWKYDFEEGRHFRTRGYGDVISSDRLLQNFDLLQDGTIVQVANEIRFEQALSMTRGMASFCQILAYVLLAVSAIIHFIYGGIVIGRLLELNDRYVRFWNVGKKAVTASCLSAIGFLALPSFALALIVAPPAFLGLTYQLPRLNGFSFQIMCQTGIGYAFLAVALFVTALVAGLTLLLGMKKYGNKRQKHLENI